jgi:hypothetical protein
LDRSGGFADEAGVVVCQRAGLSHCQTKSNQVLKANLTRIQKAGF